MINQFGNYSLLAAFFLSIYLVIHLSFLNNFKNFKTKSKVIGLLSVQCFMVIVSFISLLFAFIRSDFSNETVYNNSHTTKPIFYKISGTWGNHEGSLLLWLLVLTIFLLIFIFRSNHLSKKLTNLTLLFQEVIILGFLGFIIFTSNPFSTLFPFPKEGLGLNPILQDPILAIHPPILYLGYVGTSIIFSSSLAALVSNSINKLWVLEIKKWILVSWIFLTIGIMLGSIWAYYELGWGGFWFWDPVENVSLMPWFCLTALLHSIIVLEKRNQLHSWVLILSITTFALSMSGTFLVRSGILNSIHTFANDPTRGVYILIFLLILLVISIVIYFVFKKNIPEKKIQSFLISKEITIMTNNWFMMFFLSVVLIGTIYPIFLEVLDGSKISIGPPFYHKLITPFLIIFLVFMSVGPSIKWIKDKKFKIYYDQIFLLIISLTLSYLIIIKLGQSYLFSIPLLGISFYLFFQTSKDFLKKNLNLSQKISHFGFAILILSILLNGLLSKEFSSNMKLGDERKFDNKIMQFKNLETKNYSNFKSLIGKFEIIGENNKLIFYPEIRIYNQPLTITSEADIITNFISDNFLVFNVLKEDGYFNVRYQHKPLMLWIWISVILISLGGILRLFDQNER